MGRISSPASSSHAMYCPKVCSIVASVALVMGNESVVETEIPCSPEILMVGVNAFRSAPLPTEA
eukprot:765497-Hanusia_phi.AAC.1